MIRVNKKGGQIDSVITNARYMRVYGIEEIKNYRVPAEEDAAKVKKTAKLPPSMNFPGEGSIEVAAEEHKHKSTDYKGTHTVQATAKHGAHHYRIVFLANSGYRTVQVCVTDAKRVDKPTPEAVEPVKLEREPVAPAPVAAEQTPASTKSTDNHVAMAEDSQVTRDQLEAGVQIVSVLQFFPTSADLATRMVELADIEPRMCVLEPSIDAGRILEQLSEGCEVVAAEINAALGDHLDADRRATAIDDFLQCTPETLQGSFDRILMNPPFASADNIEHIHHVLRFLRPGGRLVATCANGSRQNDQLRPSVEQYDGE